MLGLSNTVVILVEPSGPLNVGSVARLCENFGIKELRLVSPRCNPMDKDAQLLATKGEKFLREAKIFPTLLDALVDCRRVVATCGRVHHGTIPLYSPEVALPWLLKRSEDVLTALVFGREDRGLTNDELRLAQKVLTLKSSPSYPSLNLSHAVAVVLYELHRLTDQLNHSTKGNSSIETEPAYPLELEECMSDAQELLLEIGFLLDHSAHARMAKVRALLNRAVIRSEEISLIRGMIRQIRWAIFSRAS